METELPCTVILVCFSGIRVGQESKGKKHLITCISGLQAVTRAVTCDHQPCKQLNMLQLYVILLWYNTFVR